MNKKRIISVICSIAILTMAVNVFAANTSTSQFDYTVDSKFDDVKPSDWYFEAVSKCEDLGIIYGYGDGTFGANDPVTLQQVTLMTLRTLLAYRFGYTELAGWTAPGVQLDQDHVSFQRCKIEKYIPSYRTDEIEARLHGATQFQPAYREEALSCFYRMFISDSYENFPQRIKEVNDIRGKETVFIENPNIPDYDEIHEYYKKDVYGAYQYGLAHGYDETGAFKPKNEITRAEFCQMMFESGMIETIYLQNKGLV